MLNHLNEVNDVKIYSVFDDEFKTYGRILNGYDFSDLIHYMNNKTEIPYAGNTYVPSVPEMEKTGVFSDIQAVFYGGMPAQIGYCNGRNRTYNGFEYHKSSEINIAVTDFMLVLGHIWQIKDNSFTIGDEKVFYVPEGTAIEMYQTTLHLSPCRTCDEGFKDIVILPRGTNTTIGRKERNGDKESVLLLEKNKWVIAHKDREPLVKKGAHVGIIGDNKKLKY